LRKRLERSERKYRRRVSLGNNVIIAANSVVNRSLGNILVIGGTLAKILKEYV